MSAKSVPVPDRSVARVAGIAVLISLFSFVYYFQQNDLLLYGDAIAHINIARRVFDSQTPGLLQLGTVWLPLPHVLMIPFIFSDVMWQNGTGASVPSMIAFVFGVVGIFRLVRGMLEADPRTHSVAGVGAGVAALAYGANPNLIYMQATAMTESVYLALFVWAVVYFSEFVRDLRGSKGQGAPNGQKALSRCAWCLAGAEITRYDGWFLAGVAGAAAVVLALRSGSRATEIQSVEIPALRRVVAKFLLGISAAPILWLAYNGVVYGNALEFANGPYSAKAIEERVNAPNPALHNAGVAAIYFLKSAQLNLAPGSWGRFWIAAAIAAFVVAGWKLRTLLAPFLLLAVPLIFYALSIAYGSVPLHVYTWWPFATFNQRYGLQLLPMFAVAAGIATASLVLIDGVGQRARALLLVPFVLVLASYASVWTSPLCLQEARRNWQIRHPLDSAVQRVVERLPRDARFLMNLGEHVGVMEQAGIPLRRLVNNENHRPWKRPTDPEGLWERALADPPRYADFVIAFDGDPVDLGANKSNLTLLTEIHAIGQPLARIYAANGGLNQSR